MPKLKGIYDLTEDDLRLTTFMEGKVRGPARYVRYAAFSPHAVRRQGEAFRKQFDWGWMEVRSDSGEIVNAMDADVFFGVVSAINAAYSAGLVEELPPLHGRQLIGIVIDAKCLAKHAGKTTKVEIQEEVWKSLKRLETNAVRVHSYKPSEDGKVEADFRYLQWADKAEIDGRLVFQIAIEKTIYAACISSDRGLTVDRKVLTLNGRQLVAKLLGMYLGAQQTRRYRYETLITAIGLKHLPEKKAKQLINNALSVLQKRKSSRGFSD